MWSIYKFPDLKDMENIVKDIRSLQLKKKTKKKQTNIYFLISSKRNERILPSLLTFNLKLNLGLFVCLCVCVCVCVCVCFDFFLYTNNNKEIKLSISF